MSVNVPMSSINGPVYLGKMLFKVYLVFAANTSM